MKNLEAILKDHYFDTNYLDVKIEINKNECLLTSNVLTYGKRRRAVIYNLNRLFYGNSTSQVIDKVVDEFLAQMR